MLVDMRPDEAHQCFSDMRAILPDVDGLIDNDFTSVVSGNYISYFEELDKVETLITIESFAAMPVKKLPCIALFDHQLRTNFPATDHPLPKPEGLTSTKRAAKQGLKEARAKLERLNRAG